MAVVDLDAHLATGTADILCRTLDPAFLYASVAVSGKSKSKQRRFHADLFVLLARPCVCCCTYSMVDSMLHARVFVRVCVCCYTIRFGLQTTYI